MRIAKLIPIVLTALVMISHAGCGGGGGGGSSVAVSKFDSPAITATADTGKVTVTWDNVLGAISYNAYWSMDASMTKGTGTKVVIPSSPFVLSPVTAGATYYFLVTAVNASGGESAVSNRIQISVAAPNISPVASFFAPVARFVGDAVTIDASASADSDGSITRYAVDFGDGTPMVIQASPFASHAYVNRGTFLISLAVTDDQGATNTTTRVITIGLGTQDIVNVSRTPEWSQTPVAATDSSGNLGVFWYEGGGVSFSAFPVGGSGFSTRITWSDPFFKFEQPALAASNGEFFLAWTAFPGSGGAEIAFTRSSDGGASFTDPVIVSPIDAMNSYIPSISAEGSELAITWADADLLNSGLPSGVTLARSTDSGQTFYPPLMVAEAGLCPNVALANGKTFLSWYDSASEQTFFALSSNGTTFSAPLQVSTTTERTWCPNMRVDRDGRIYILWPEGSAFTRIRMSFSVSSDGGTTFSTPVIISDPALDSRCGSLAVGPDGAVMATWSTGDSYGSSFTSYLVYSADHGATFSPAMKIPVIDGESMCPSIVSRSNNEVGIFWANPSRLPPVSGTYVLPDILYSTVVVPH